MAKFSNFVHVQGAPVRSSGAMTANTTTTNSSFLDITEPTCVSNYAVRMIASRDKATQFMLLIVACPDDVATAIANLDFIGDTDNLEYYKQFVVTRQTGFYGQGSNLNGVSIELSTSKKFDLRVGDKIGYILCTRDCENSTNGYAYVVQQEYDYSVA